MGGGPPQGPSTALPRPLTRGDPLSGLALHCLLQEAPGPAAGCGPCSLRRWPEAEGGLWPHAWASLSFSPAVSQGKRAPEREFVAGPLAGPSGCALCTPQPHGRALQAWCPPRAHSDPAGSLDTGRTVPGQHGAAAELEGSGPHGGATARSQRCCAPQAAAAQTSSGHQLCVSPLLHPRLPPQPQPRPRGGRDGPGATLEHAPAWLRGHGSRLSLSTSWDFGFVTGRALRPWVCLIMALGPRHSLVLQPSEEIKINSRPDARAGPDARSPLTAGNPQSNPDKRSHLQ